MSVVTSNKHAHCHTVIVLAGALMILMAWPGFAEDLPHGDDAPDRVKEAPPEKGKADGLRRGTVEEEARSPRVAPASPFLSSPIRPLDITQEHFHWKSALNETFLFTSIMHAKRLTDPDTGPELKGPLFKDYFRSVAGLHGWDDHDPYSVQYIGHSFHGATDSRIELQNNPNGRAIDWGAPGYWHSRFVAMAWSTLWGAQFKVGLYSEAMIGNVGLPNQYRKKPLPPDTEYGIMAWSEFVVNPVCGTAWVVTEDLLDRYVVRRMEGRSNRYFMYVARSFLTPSRAWANLLRFKRPWYRETRSINGSAMAFQ